MEEQLYRAIYKHKGKLKMRKYTFYPEYTGDDKALSEIQYHCNENGYDLKMLIRIEDACGDIVWQEKETRNLKDLLNNQK
ncbi:MAG: hypothetical protein GY679_01765 [Mycoplasma sp.]|nr:hypothetical protein [Mycoplasma sp.]